MHALPSEIVPLLGDLGAYDGLRNIRFRKDGELAIGLFLREKDEKTVVTISPSKNAPPFVFDIEPVEANAAFEEPWPYAPRTGKVILQNTLTKDNHPEEA
jgi:hypothetical protein